MLLTITYRGERASELGYLLHKNPSRTQEFKLSYGKAYVFYPKVEESECTAALLIDINPVDLARGKVGSTEGGLFDYVNDRPYVASSFMSTALSKVYSTAMSGRCNSHPELAASPLDLEARITMLPCRGDVELLHRIFEPLRYTVTYQSYPLDNKFQEWGNSDYVDLTIRGRVKLCDLLNHLYVLIPVFDKQKHYWISDDEVDKLLHHGDGWLSSHPEMKLITRRYFNRKISFAHRAIEKLLDIEEIESVIEELPEEVKEKTVDPEASEDAATEVTEKRVPLNDQRLDAVVRAVRDCGARSVVDLGCGEGRLLVRLINEKQITKLLGLDVSILALERAKERLRLDRIPEFKRDKVTLVQGSLTYRDKRIEGFDAACIIEVLEHLDIDRLMAFERVVFEFTKPKTVIITTPNKEYNKVYKNLNARMMRHGDHRFEWTRAEFRSWADDICQRYGYSVVFTDIGEMNADSGAPTQMGVFTKCR